MVEADADDDNDDDDGVNQSMALLFVVTEYR